MFNKPLWEREIIPEPWIDETTGYLCSIVRQPASGHLCGYVCVPFKHPARKLVRNLFKYGLYVHGGVSFVQYTPYGDIKVGFDCSHSMDLRPFDTEDDTMLDCGNKIYRDVEYVRGQILGLAQQLFLLKTEKQFRRERMIRGHS